MFGRMKKISELEGHLQKLQVNASNNYKDEAQKNFSDFLEAFERLDAEGKLPEKQRTYYAGVAEELKVKLKGYSHDEQKPDYRGLYKEN